MITVYNDLVQGSDEWLAARCGMLTASEMHRILTPTLKVASNEKERAHLYELLAQRITGYVEPAFISDDMLRGHEDEVEAKILYSQNYAPVEDVGFVTNDEWGFLIGYSPDGFVGDEGLIECKSRRQKFQVQTILDQQVPDEFMVQIQTGLLVTDRKWCDFVSYAGGMPMTTIRVKRDHEMQDAIIDAATAFEMRIKNKLIAYHARIRSDARLVPTVRRVEQEILV